MAQSTPARRPRRSLRNIASDFTRLALVLEESKGRTLNPEVVHGVAAAVSDLRDHFPGLTKLTSDDEENLKEFMLLAKEEARHGDLRMVGYYTLFGLGLVPLHPALLHSLGVAFAGYGQITEAIELCELAAWVNPGYTAAKEAAAQLRTQLQPHPDP